MQNRKIMEFEGVVFRKLPELSGTSAKGAWRKQDVVFELPGEFNRKICVTFFGDRTEDAAALAEGDAITVSANVESREYNGKWYTDVKAWKIVRGASEPNFNARDGMGAAAGFSPDAPPDTNRSSGNQSGSSFQDTPFNKNDEFASPSDDVDDLPF
jgi:single-stranded DNA-binding protein